jgi:hypothetical protein
MRTDRRRRGSNIAKFRRRLGDPTLAVRLKFQVGPSNSKHTLSPDEETTGREMIPCAMSPHRTGLLRIPRQSAAKSSDRAYGSHWHGGHFSVRRESVAY